MLIGRRMFVGVCRRLLAGEWVGVWAAGGGVAWGAPNNVIGSAINGDRGVYP